MSVQRLAIKYCLFFLCWFAIHVAAQPACDEVFPDGASSIQNGNTITFQWNSKIFSSPDNILQTNGLVDNGNPGTSCDSSACSASGTYAESINYNSFVNNQPDVTLGYQQAGIISAGDYNNLTLASEAILSMNPGVYTFRGSVDLQYLSEIVVNSAGTVVIYVRGTVTLSSEAKINNANGDRYVFLFTRDTVTMQSNSILKGVVYSRGNVTLQNGAHLTGALTARANITLNSASYITYNSSAVANTNFDSLCTSTPSSTATLVSYWQFDEYAWFGTASEIVDASGNGNHGTAQNSLSTSTVTPAINADPGTCYYGEFDGASHYANMPNLSATLNGTASLAFWVKTTEVGTTNAWSSPAITGVEENAGVEDIFWGWIDNNGRIGLAIGNGTNAKSTSVINDGVWHHVVLTRDTSAGQFKIYVDGVLENSGVIASRIIANSYSSIGRVEVVGTTTTPIYFAGSIDEVQVYSGVLSDAEVTTIMAQTHVCPTVMCASDAPASGLFGEYYNSTNLTGTPNTRTDTSIDFNWGTGAPGVTGIGSDNFSIDWNGYVRAEETGTYFFQTESDDGVRLWVDGNLVIDNWTNHSPTVNTSTGVTLTAGQAYPVTLQYYENGGGAVIRLRWQTPSSGGYSAIAGGNTPILSSGIYSCPTPVPPEAMCTTGGIPTPGLEGDYYNTVDFTGGVIGTRVDATVDYDWGTGAPGVTGVNANQFSVDWNGYIRVEETGYYSFQTDSDDGVRLWVGGQLLINNWSDHAVVTDTSSGISLEAGETYAIQMQFYENGGYATARLRWQTPSGGSYVILPAGTSPTLGEGSYYCAPDMPDHYGISHAGTGITCEAEAVTITAYDAANNPFIPVAGTSVTLSDSIGDGTWSPSNTYTFTGTESNFTAYLRQITPATISVNVTDGTSTESASLDPDITFVESLLRFYGDTSNSVVPNQIAGVTDNNVVVRAVETDDTGACIARIANSSFTGRLAFECINPSNCVAGQTLSLDGDNAQANNSGAAIAYTTVTMDFNAQGYSSLPLQYSDVGQVRLHGQVDIPAQGNEPAITLEGTSNNFIVKPYTIAFQTIESSGGTTNPQAANGGTGFVAAGEAFTVLVESRNALNNITPNFGQESTAESVRVEFNSLVYPSTGSVGSLTSPNNFSPVGGVNGRFQNASLAWNEVGGITLDARLADDDYLGAGDLAAISTSNTIGRFYPDSFALNSSNVTEACGAFSYMSQPAIGVQYQVQANAVGGAAVTNYDSALGYAPLASFTHSAENADSGTNLASRLAISSSSWASGVYNLNTITAAFNRTSVLEAPLTQLQLGVALNDTDGRSFTAYDTHAGASGDCIAAGNCSAVALGSEMEVRFGRLILADAFGPETAPLAMDMRTEYWNGTNWVNNIADSCTQISNADIAFPNGTIDSVANKTVTVGGGTSSASFPYSGLTYVGFTNGDAGASLSAPGAGNTGNFKVDIDLTNYPWLLFDWNQDGDYSNDTALPSAQFSFGSYRGHDRIIYWREVLGQ